MKKLGILVLAAVLGLSVAVSSGPFVGFDFTIPDDATLCLGFREGSLTCTFTVDDLLQTAPAISFLAEYLFEYSYWDNEFQCWIGEIDFTATYPVPTVEEMGLLWRGTIHVGTLLDELAEPPLTLSSSALDLYGQVSFKYKYDTRQLIPTGSIGFYWEP